MKLDEFLKSPAGKGAIIPGKEMILSNLNYRLQILLKNKDIKVNIYTNKEFVYYHFLIPTESEEKENAYDVIIKFKPIDKSSLIDKSYKQYNIEFFSNCPSFTYGYAYVANLNGLLATEFVNKYEDKTLKYPPISRNPGLTFGYEKSIYFACKYLSDNKHILAKSYVDLYGTKLTEKIKKEIRNMNQIDEEIKRETKKVKAKKEDVKKQANQPKERKKNDKYVNNQNKSSSGVKTVKKTVAKKSGNHKIQPIKKR